MRRLGDGRLWLLVAVVLMIAVLALGAVNAPSLRYERATLLFFAVLALIAGLVRTSLRG